MKWVFSEITGKRAVHDTHSTPIALISRLFKNNITFFIYNDFYIVLQGYFLLLSVLLDIYDTNMRTSIRLQTKPVLV